MRKNYQLHKSQIKEPEGQFSRNFGTRILFIAPQPFYEDRGTPIAVKYTLEALSQLGFSVDLATFPQGTDVAIPRIHLNRASNPLKYRHVPVGLSFRKVFLDISLIITIFRLILRNNYHCVHGVEEGAAIALVIKAIFRWPVVYDMQSSLPEQLKAIRGLDRGLGRWFCIMFERWLVKNADFILASKGLAPRVLSIDNEKKVTECNFNDQYTFIPKSDFGKCSKVTQPPKILYTGNFAPYQDLKHLLEAVAIVKMEIPNVKLLLVGGTEIEIHGLTKSIRKLRLDDNVQLFMRQARQKLIPFYRLADALVLPRTRGENAPLKLFEYMKIGKPIIATDIPAHRSLLSEDTALIVKPKVASIANGIIQVLKDREFALSVAQRASAASKNNEKHTPLEAVTEIYKMII